MILIVDDKPENIYSLKTLLEINKFAVDTASSGEEALKKVLKKSYALIILDVQMPDMDGFEVAEAIGSYNKTKDIPIIFLSAVNTDKRFITKGYSSGGIDYVTKPFDADILLLKVKTFYRLYEQNTQLTNMQRILQDEIDFRKHAERELKTQAENLEQIVAERTEELTIANRQLQEANNELSQYAWITSHDLQEPLRKIHLFSHILKDRFIEQDSEADSYLQRIIQSSTRMNNQIRDVLNYTQLSFSEKKITEIDLNDVLVEVTNNYELLIKEKQATLNVHSLPKIFMAHVHAVQVFNNLVGNALKYSKEDVNPCIEVASELVAEKEFEAEKDEQGNFCRITVSDNGIGFNEKYAGRIFTIFNRLHSTDEFSGNGIGLAIVKKIVDKYDGIITAQSKTNEGATFTLVLPLHANEN